MFSSDDAAAVRTVRLTGVSVVRSVFIDCCV
jgi:hypothetical protein